MKAMTSPNTPIQRTRKRPAPLMAVVRIKIQTYSIMTMEKNKMAPVQSLFLLVSMIVCQALMAGQQRTESVGNSAFSGIWQYQDAGERGYPHNYVPKHYLKITEEAAGRFRLIEGFKDGFSLEKGFPFVGDDDTIDWHEDRSDVISLKLSGGKLRASIISGDFRPTHGQKFTYKLTIEPTAKNKIRYSIWSSMRGGETETFEATLLTAIAATHTSQEIASSKLAETLGVTTRADWIATHYENEVLVGSKTVHYGPSKFGVSYADLEFGSEFSNVYTLDCEKRQFLRTKTIKWSDGWVQDEPMGDKWWPLKPTTTEMNAVYEAICPQLLAAVAATFLQVRAENGESDGGAAVTGEATPADRLEVKDGSTLSGKIKGGKVAFESSFGEIEVNIDDVRSYADGKLSLADGTVLKGAFREGSVEVATSGGNVEVPLQSIEHLSTGSKGMSNSAIVQPAPGQGILTGRLLDNFGKPVSDASVRIAETGFVAQTDSSGTYKIPYVPGNITVVYEHAGYDTISFALQLAQASTYPVEDKTLLKLPPQQGVFFWNTDGWSPLGECNLQQISTIPNDGDINFNVRKEAYRVNGVPYRIVSNSKPVFMAYGTESDNLLVYRVGRDGKIVTRMVKGGLGGFGAMLSNSRSSKGTSIAKAWKTQPFPNRSFLLTENQSGVYAVVNRSYKDACFMFQIGDTRRQVRHLESGKPSKPRTINVGNKVVTYWPSQSNKAYTLFRFDSKGYRNTYTLNCEKSQFLWIENIQVSTGNVTGNSTGAEWRSMNPKSTIANAVYGTICPTIFPGKHGAREGNGEKWSDTFK